MASTLYENVENWHRSGESRDVLSSDETEPFSFKGEDHDDLYEEVQSKQHSLKEIADETATAKENGHDYDRVNGNAVNGNGVHEKHSEDACNDYEEDEEEKKDDKVDDQDNGEENDSDRAETKEDEPAPQVPYYGRTLVAPEYMNFQLPEETSQREEQTAEDDGNNGTSVTDDSNDLGPSKNIQVEDNREEDVRAEGAFDPTVQKEVLEEDDLTLSEGQTDEEDDDGLEEDEAPVKEDFYVKEEDEKEEDEEDRVEDEREGDGEREEEVQEDTTGEESKLYSDIDHEGSPHLAQAEDEDEEQSEDDGLEEENENDGVKLEKSLLKEDEADEETESKEVDTRHVNQKETCPQLAEADDDDNDEEIDNEDTDTLKESNLKHSDSLKVHVASPTPDIGEVASAAESFDDGEGFTIKDAEGDKVDQEQSLNKTYHDKEDENRRTTFNGPVEEYDGQQNKDVETEEEMVQGDEGCESEDTNEESGDETADIVCEPDQDEAKEEHTSDEDKLEDGLDLDTIPEGEGAESDRDDQDEDFSVHTSLQGRYDESDLTGKVKELGRMFEGGGPVFPKTVKNDTDAVDGSPVSVRRYKAIFEQDRLSAERAREPGRREEITSPPRGIVKNLRGMFENPQGFEARTG